MDYHCSPKFPTQKQSGGYSIDNSHNDKSDDQTMIHDSVPYYSPINRIGGSLLLKSCTLSSYNVSQMGYLFVNKVLKFYAIYW